jgi:succinate-semialdehyde dehydrogenase/glutarate-semialdehyde dehydrogenase
MSFQTINPATNQVVKSFDEFTDASLEKAVANAALAFNDWKKTD